MSQLFPSLLGHPYVTGQWGDPISARGGPAGQFHTQVTLISVGRFHPAGIVGCSMVYKCREIVHAALYSIYFLFVILFFALLNYLFQGYFFKQDQTMLLLMGNSLQPPCLPYFKVNYLICCFSLPSLPMSAHQCFLTQ